MKKTSVIILAAICALALAACSQKAAETTAAETTAAVETATVPEEILNATYDIDAINDIVANLDVSEPEVLGTVSKLADYKGLELTAPEPAVITDDDALAYLDAYVLPGFTEEVDVIEEGDIANIDYEGKKDGVAFDGGTAQGYDLEIGSGSFIDGFESGLIGKKKGETVDLNLKFPENYGNTDLAGQSVVFTVTVNSISRQRELTDELAPQIDESCKTKKDVIESAKKKLQSEENLVARQELYYNAVTKVIEGSEIEPSEDAIRYATNTYVKNYAASAELYGLDLGTLLSYYGSSYEEFADSYKENAVESTKQRLVLQEIAKLENLEVTDESVNAFAESYGYTAESIREILDENLLNELVIEEMANQVIVDNAKVTYTKSEE